jgi:acetyl-CoA C-acetyltransferase
VAIEAGLFDEEVVPIKVKARNGTVEFRVDEHFRRDATLETFAKLKPAFKKDGTVTAVNASGVNDAAAAVVVMSADRAKELNAPVRARILYMRCAAWSQRRWGIGPFPAVRKALERAGKTLDDVEVIELNEAFAAQSLAVLKDLDLDPAKVNPNGEAIALGHPIAATGVILTTKILGEIERENHKLGLVTLCIGGGQGIAMLLERD